MGAARVLLGGVLLLLVAPGQSYPVQNPAADKEPDTTAEDQKALKGVGQGVDGPALLEYFRKRTFPEADPHQVKNFIRNLGHEEFRVREKAQAQLLALGPGALFGLKQAEASADVETRSRALELRHLIEAKAEPAIQSATARLVARFKPAGAAEVLLAYLPFAADASVVEELCKALAVVAVKDGKPDAAVVKSLSDKHPLKRGGAAQALTQLAGEVPRVRKLLADGDPSVRLRVALALVQRKEKAALPVLVDALGHLSPELLWPAEEILVRLAGDKSPPVSLGTNDISRKACRDAWAGWLHQNKDKIDLAKLTQAQAMLGYTLIVQQPNNGRGTGEITELDAARKTKWSFEIPGYPVDAQIVGPERVLVAEFQAGRVSECDFKGKIIWQKAVNGNPIGAQRLANGNTFVVLQNRLMEYNKKGEEVYSFQGPHMFRARKMKNGEIVFVTSQGQLTRMEAKTQRTIKTFDVGNPASLFGGIDVLANGNVIVPQYQNKRVVEFDRDGKQVGTPITMDFFPNSAVRLPNGHTLVGCLSNKLIAEYDRNGRQLWQHQTGGAVFNVRRR